MYQIQDDLCVYVFVNMSVWAFYICVYISMNDYCISVYVCVCVQVYE